MPASAVPEENPLAIGALIASALGILGLAGYFVVRNRRMLRMQMRRLRHRYSSR